MSGIATLDCPWCLTFMGNCHLRAMGPTWEAARHLVNWIAYEYGWTINREGEPVRCPYGHRTAMAKAGDMDERAEDFVRVDFPDDPGKTMFVRQP